MYEKGLVIGMIISQGGGGPDEVKLGAIIQTPPIIQTTPISFLQRLVMLTLYNHTLFRLFHSNSMLRLQQITTKSLMGYCSKCSTRHHIFGKNKKRNAESLQKLLGIRNRTNKTILRYLPRGRQRHLLLFGLRLNPHHSERGGVCPRPMYCCYAMPSSWGTMS